jgi:Calcineurin-like phosphoesterase/Purple acid Phosphatase, N-terminal domain
VQASDGGPPLGGASRGRSVRLAGVALALSATLLVSAVPGPSAAAASAALWRYPYLTDLVKRKVTINWATTTDVSTGAITYGRSGAESCTAHTVTAKKVNITVGATPEYQWRARVSALAANTAYCYRIFGGSTDLLGAEASPVFRSQVRPGSKASFSFAVLGDWGYVDSNGRNDDQAALMRQIAASGARFAVTTGDTAYPSGDQLSYGDLVHVGAGTSTIFGRDFWTIPGSSIAMFNAQGNHGLTNAALLNWPEGAAVKSSGGRYRMETYCCANNTSPASYPSSWYAFDAGRARFYVLESAWSSRNLGDADLYENDYDNHWTPKSDEYRWLANDLATHPAAIKFAFFHFPLYSDNSAEKSDPWLNGSGSLEALLADNGVDLIFNGHAHFYERNAPSGIGMPTTYVTGGGGAKLEAQTGCSGFDLYAVGWWYSSNMPGSACGAATRPSTIDRVFHFLLVTVDGSKVTVTPTDELGRTFDVRDYPVG